MAVVGGSAAGLLTAGLVARAGRPVRILESSGSLSPAARTLIVTSRMRELLGPVGDASIVNEIRRFELFTDGRSAEISLTQPDLIIERSTLIHKLAEQAQHAGAQLQLGRRFLKLHADGEGLTLVVERRSGGHEEVRAGTVVGADGATSKVAKAAGWPEQDTVPLLQAIVRLPSDYPPATVRVWFVPDDTPYFYWLIPESPERGALGLIAEDGKEARSCLNRFLEKRHFTPISFQGARIPVYRRWVPVSKPFGKGHVYLVGDAAAQVKVTTVGGIVTGFRGAIGAAEAILNSGRSRELRKLRRELGMHLLIRKALHRFQQADYSRLVDLMNTATLRTLSVHTRDEAARVLWKIALNQPRILLQGLRGLLTKEPFGRQRQN